jgi:hypothetical protein
MRMKSLVMAGLGAAGVVLAATSLQAAPVNALTAGVDRNAEHSGLIENVTWWWGRRHCHWEYGYRHCWYEPRHYWHDGYYRPHYRHGYYDHYGYWHRY